ncbi:hypothetical protein ACS0TY_026151 [Phlomoides rotata]
MSGARQPTVALDPGNRMPTAQTSFGAGNPSMTLRNLIFSPIKQPQISRLNIYFWLSFIPAIVSLSELLLVATAMLVNVTTGSAQLLGGSSESKEGTWVVAHEGVRDIMIEELDMDEYCD